MSDQADTTASTVTHPSITTIFSPMSDLSPEQQSQPQSQQPTPLQPTQPFSPAIPKQPVIETSTDQHLYFFILGKSYPVDSPTGYLIGRGEVCDIRVNDQQVSTRHCQIKNGVLIDMRSTNGTSINGAILPPNQPHTLKANDLVYIGSTEITIKPQEETSGTSTPLDLSGLPPPAATNEQSPTNANNMPSIPASFAAKWSSSGGRIKKTPHMQRSLFAPLPSDIISSSSSSSSTTTNTTTVPSTPSVPLNSSILPPVDIDNVNNNNNNGENDKNDKNDDNDAKNSEKNASEPTFAQSVLSNLPPVQRFGQSLTAPPAGATTTTTTGVPSTDEILASDPVAQRQHVEFLRSEIFRLRRANLLDKRALDKKKPGLIGGFTSGGDNADIFKEVVDLKKQMNDMKFVFLYGDDEDTIQAGMAVNDLSILLRKKDDDDNNNGDKTNENDEKENSASVAKITELTTAIKTLEYQLSQKDEKITTLQGAHDVAQNETELKYQSLLRDKDAELRALTSAAEQETQETALKLKNEFEIRLKKLQDLISATNEQNSDYLEQLNALQDKYSSLETQFMVLESQQKNNKGNSDDEKKNDFDISEREALVQKYNDEIQLLRQQLEEKLIVSEEIEKIKREKIEWENEKNALAVEIEQIKQEKLKLLEKNSQLEKNIAASTDQSIVTGTTTTSTTDTGLIDQIQSQLDISNSKNVTLEAQNASLMTEKTTLTTQNANLIAEKDKMEAQLNELRQKYELLSKNQQADTSVANTTTDSVVNDSSKLIEDKYVAQIDELNKKLSTQTSLAKDVDALLNDVLKLIIQDDVNLSQSEKVSILGDPIQRQKFIKTNALQQTLSSKQSSISTTPNTNTNSTDSVLTNKNDSNRVVDPVQLIQSLPPQVIAMIALPAAVIAAIFAMAIR